MATGKDIDDISAIVVLAELRRRGFVEVVGAVANYKPSLRRTQLVRGAFDLLGMQNVPVAVGTDATDFDHVVREYEFDTCNFMSERTNFEDGQSLIHRLMLDAVDRSQKLTIVLLSPLRDVDIFARAHRDLFVTAVESVHMQGGYVVTREGELAPWDDVANNANDISSARSFHKFLQDNGIQSTAYTRLAAYAADIPAWFFRDLALTGRIGTYLRRAQVAQELRYWQMASEIDPAKRRRPELDKTWFLRTRTSFYSSGADKNAPRLPIGDEVVPYISKIILYDVLAVMGAAGGDVAGALGVRAPLRLELSRRHTIVGISVSEPGVDDRRVKDGICALMRESLLAQIDQ